MIGGSGVDTLFGGSGNDSFVQGNTGVFPPTRADGGTIFAGTGDDTLVGDDGTDTLGAGTGNDTRFCADGNDSFFMNTGTDVAYGGDGDNSIFGGDNDDYIYGQADEDFLYGGTGNDTLQGGADYDVFVFVEGGGNDIILDLIVDLDQIDLSAFNITFADLIFTGDVITIDGVDDFSIDLNGVAAASLSADDFIL